MSTALLCMSHSHDVIVYLQFYIVIIINPDYRPKAFKFRSPSLSFLSHSCVSAVVLENMVLVSRRLEDLKKGLGLEQKDLSLGLD